MLNTGTDENLPYLSDTEFDAVLQDSKPLFNSLLQLINKWGKTLDQHRLTAKQEKTIDKMEKEFNKVVAGVK